MLNSHMNPINVSKRPWEFTFLTFFQKQDLAHKFTIKMVWILLCYVPRFLKELLTSLDYHLDPNKIHIWSWISLWGSCHMHWVLDCHCCCKQQKYYFHGFLRLPNHPFLPPGSFYHCLARSDPPFFVSHGHLFIQASLIFAIMALLIDYIKLVKQASK
jgi:hypothetical protein